MPHFEVEFHNIIVLYQNFGFTKYKLKQKDFIMIKTRIVINIQHILLNDFEND